MLHKIGKIGASNPFEKQMREVYARIVRYTFEYLAKVDAHIEILENGELISLGPEEREKLCMEIADKVYDKIFDLK